VLSVGATDRASKTKEHNVKTTQTLKQTIAGALLAGGVVAAGLLAGAGTGHTSPVYGTGDCPVGHYCGLLGR